MGKISQHGHFAKKNITSELCIFSRRANGLPGVILPDSKVHGANMGPTWVLSAPCGPHVGPINLAVRAAIQQEKGRTRVWTFRVSLVIYHKVNTSTVGFNVVLCHLIHLLFAQNSTSSANKQ